MIATVARGLLLLLLVPSAALADGAPDPAFNHGHVAAFAPQRFSAASGVSVDGQGRILIAATVDDGLLLHPRAAVLRLLPDGTLDPAFGAGGVATVEPPAPYRGTRAEAMAVDPAGRVVLAGEVDDDIPAVMRLLPGGGPDPSFGSGGIVVENGIYGGAPAWWWSIALDGPDIIVAGAAVDSPPFGSGLDRQTVLARFSDAGTPDPSFANGGFLSLDLPGISLAQPQSLAIDDAGRIVLGLSYAATTAFPRDVTLEVARLAHSGAIDTAFGSSGLVTLGLQRGAALRLSVRAGGELLVVGGWGPTAITTPGIVAARLTADGRLDDAFGTHGQLTAPAGYAGAGIADCRGDLVIAATSGLQRLGPDGRLDPSFRAQSLVTATVGATPLQARLSAAAFAPGGAIVALGTFSDGPSRIGGAPGTQIGSSTIAVQRLRASCPPPDSRPPAVSLQCSAGCRRVTGVALDDPVGRGVRRVRVGVERRTGTTCTAWNGRRFSAIACGRGATRLVAVPVVRGAFRSPPLGSGAWVVRVVAIDRAGNRSRVAVRRVTR